MWLLKHLKNTPKWTQKTFTRTSAWKENITGFSEGVQGVDILLSYMAAWTFYTQMLFWRLDVVLPATAGSKTAKDDHSFPNLRAIL